MRTVLALVILAAAVAIDLPGVLQRRETKEIVVYVGMLTFAAWMLMGAAAGWYVPGIMSWLDRVFNPVYHFIHTTLLGG